MKKLILILVLVFASLSMVGQAEYNKWAVSVEYGSHNVSDESAILLDKVTEHDISDGHHYGLSVRYNFNPIFGVGLVGGFDNLALETFEHDAVALDYGRLNVEIFINWFQLFDLQNNIFTMIGHGGPGVGFIRTDNDYNTTIGNVSGGLTGLFKATDWLGVYLDWTSTGNFSQGRTLDGEFVSTNTGINSVIHNYSIGLAFYLGKKDKDGKRKRHADWVVPVAVVPVVNNYITNPVTVITKVVEVPTIVATPHNHHDEYIFFDYDSSDFRDSELNALFKVTTELENNPEFTVVIKSYASPTDSSEDYNKVLSDKRASVILDKLRALQIDRDRISIESFGKDHEVDGEKSVFDTARRVELIVVRK